MKEQLNKYKWWIIAGIAVFILLSAKSCVNNQYNQIRGENKILKEQVKTAQDGVKVAKEERLRLKDSIKSEDAEKEQKIKELSNKVATSESKVRDLQANNAKTKKEIKNLSLVGVAKELNATYGGNNATAKEKSVDVAGSMPYQILETVADANSCSEIVKEKDVQLTAKDSMLVVKDSQIKDSSTLLFSAEKEIKKHEELNKIQTDFSKNLEKENKKLRTKSFLNKILIPVAIGLGAYGGYRLTK